jgi:putative ABC transport system permease protein
MTEFFGVPTTAIAGVLLALLALAVGSVAVVRWRQPILFEIGLRNIPRRPAQSVLIVLGLMLSTVIIAAALATGDTVTHSITDDAYERLGRVDVLVQVRSNSLTPSFEDEELNPVGILDPNDIDNLVAEFNGVPEADGVLPGLRFPAPVTNPDIAQTQSQAVVMGLDPGRLDGFREDIVGIDGEPFDVSQLQRAEAVANESLARALGLGVGQRIDIFVNGAPRTVRIMGIVRDRYITGWTLKQPAGLVLNLDTALFLFNLPATDVSQVRIGSSFVAISAAGDVRDTLGLSGEVTQRAIDAVRTSRLQVVPIKADRIQDAEDEGASLAAIFIVLGLFSIAAGMLLIFLILVMLAAERKTEMGMSRAVGMRRGQLIQAFMAEGMAYSLVSALLGVGLGVAVSVGMAQAMEYIFSDSDVDIAFYVDARSVVIAYAIGVILTFVTVVAAAWRVSRLSIVAAIREVNEPAQRATGMVSVAIGVAVLGASITLLVWGLMRNEAYLAGSGISLLLIGVAFVARSLGIGERPAFTVASVAVLVLWVLIAGGNLEFATGRLTTGLETFFVGGVLMVAAATFAIIYNADILLGAVRGVGVIFARAVPAVRTAVAYPLANRFRTGTTIAMLSLVVFALVMISTMNVNFRELFLDPAARGGWDIEVEVQPANPIPEDDQGNRLGPLGEALDRAFYDTQKIEEIGTVQVSNPRTTQVAQMDEAGRQLRPRAFQVFGADDVFLEENRIPLQARANGFGSNREVWEAVRDDPSNAVVDGSVVPGINYANVTETRFTLQGFESGTSSFAPFPLLIGDTATGQSKIVRVIGIMERGPSETYRGLWMSDSVASVFEPQFQRYYIKLAPGTDASGEALDVEERLALYGLSAVSIQEEVEDQQSLSNAFFVLVQGFLAIGLGVGLVALAVIALRTVVERRQQIGLMRAIGYTRTNIALSFVLESAFVAALGVANGIWPALLLANRLLASDEFSAAGFTTFHVPWVQIALMGLGVFAVSVLTTVIPSRQASGIPPAEALRYE